MEIKQFGELSIEQRRNVLTAETMRFNVLLQVINILDSAEHAHNSAGLTQPLDKYMVRKKLFSELVKEMDTQRLYHGELLRQMSDNLQILNGASDEKMAEFRKLIDANSKENILHGNIYRGSKGSLEVQGDL